MEHSTHPTITPRSDPQKSCVAARTGTNLVKPQLESHCGNPFNYCLFTYRPDRGGCYLCWHCALEAKSAGAHARLSQKRLLSPAGLFRQPPLVGAHTARIMLDATAHHCFGADAVFAGCKIEPERQAGGNLLADHKLGLFSSSSSRTAHRHRSHPHRDHHVRFSRKRPCVHADTEPVGRFSFAGHVIQPMK